MCGPSLTGGDTRVETTHHVTLGTTDYGRLTDGDTVHLDLPDGSEVILFLSAEVLLALDGLEAETAGSAPKQTTAAVDSATGQTAGEPDETCDCTETEGSDTA